MDNRQSDTKTTKQIRIDVGWHMILKMKATRAGKSIKQWLEDYLSDHGVTEDSDD